MRATVLLACIAGATAFSGPSPVGECSLRCSACVRARSHATSRADPARIQGQLGRRPAPPLAAEHQVRALGGIHSSLASNATASLSAGRCLDNRAAGGTQSNRLIVFGDRGKTKWGSPFRECTPQAPLQRRWCILLTESVISIARACCCSFRPQCPRGCPLHPHVGGHPEGSL